jgi:hypothetical protein
LTPDSIQQKYAQTVVSTRIVPGCCSFWGRKNVFTQPGSFADIALDGGLVGFGANSGLSQSRAKPDSG